ncbi:Amidohydrolase [Peptoclostridium litorale DSM 5388]|uniref:Amidohydrolase-related domain-containing protein n=1 Tax=Peptoclostridium litorale DSM 5388 TaxID=1121324 RepID=A0A069REF6_PEPLI|nr:amidohydrolase family protein [Peptoclostridium litorale]KDR95421.1 hypothetical protein CLIT_10c01480 [Peptoclostridium litorale DSM 5388]SIO19100.1 Amidohydrolase [Peptoclostridium litorale DSM 5388]
MPSEYKYPIDCHMHMTSCECADLIKSITGKKTFNGNPFGGHDHKSIISLLDNAGIYKGFAISSAYIYSMEDMNIEDPIQNTVRENDFVIRECSLSNGRLIPFFSVNPLTSYALDEVTRCCRYETPKGLKLHFTNSRIDIEDKYHLSRLSQILSVAESNSIPVIIHFRSRRNENPQKALKFIDFICENHKNLKIIIAHIGGWGGFDEITKLTFELFLKGISCAPLKVQENIYLDFSGVVITPNEVIIGTFKETIGSDIKCIESLLQQYPEVKIMFGSDWPFIDSASYIENMKNFNISENTLASILSQDFEL